MTSQEVFDAVRKGYMTADEAVEYFVLERQVRWLERNRNRVAWGFGIVAALFFALIVSGCASAFDNAKLFKGATSETINRSALAWLEYDAEHQEQLVAAAKSRDEGVKALSDFRANVQAPVSKAFKTAAKAIDELDDGLRATDAAKRKDWSGLYQAIFNAAGDLVQALKTLGVPIPLPEIAR